MLNLINETIADLHDDAGLTNPPYFIINNSLNLLTLISHESHVNSFDLGTYKLRLNQAVGTLFEGLTMVYSLDYPDAPLIVEMIQNGNKCNELGGDMRQSPVADLDYFYFMQDYYSLGNWQCLNKVIILSNTIPIRAETLSGKPGDPTSGQSVSMPVLFDFIPTRNFLTQVSSVVQYENKGEHRLIDLIGQNPLKNINISLGWEDYLGNIYPLYITSYKSVNIKLGFFKKELFNNRYSK